LKHNISSRDKSIFLRTLKLARLGMADSQYEVGLMYANGVGVAQSFDQAMVWIHQSAEKGFVAAQYLLATRYQYGVSIERDERKAMVWYQRAADQGHAKAHFRLGKMHGTAHREAAYACYLRAADMGLPDAQLAVADALAEGNGVRLDDGQALKWYVAAADQGFAPAQCALANLLAQGRGVAQDLNAAFDLYRKAARQFYAPAQVALSQLESSGLGRSASGRSRRKVGVTERRRDFSGWEQATAYADPYVKYCLGRMLELGLGVEQSDAVAAAWYVKAANQNSVEAQLALAEMHERRGDHAAIGWYQKAAELGSATAQKALGRILAASPQPTDPQNILLSAFWYARASQAEDKDAFLSFSELVVQQGDALAVASLTNAALLGVAQAQYLLGERLLKGNGVALSHAGAFDWFQKAALQGHTQAQCALGISYLEGRGVAIDVARAFEWLQKAADQGDVRAQWNVGSIFAAGRLGSTRDLRQAFMWCQKAADGDFVPAQATLGVLYERIKNYPLAVHWLQIAANQGDPEAQYNFALMYIKGEGVPANPQEAFRWMARSAAQGIASAQARLGLMYATGSGVALDPIEAHKWHVLAARGGDEAGVANRDRSEKRLTASQAAEGVRRASSWKLDHEHELNRPVF